MDEEDQLIEVLVKPFFDAGYERVWVGGCCEKIGVFMQEPGKCRTCGQPVKSLRVERDTDSAESFSS